MVMSLSLLLQFAGVFAGTRVLSLNVNILGVILLTFIPILVTNFVPGLAGLLIAIISYVVIIKKLDSSATGFQMMGILIISIALQAFVINQVLVPMFN
tara:strand:+ start:86 stop:379 length:294 start_codon:yes stop_codon:yes gene_type:complete